MINPTYNPGAYRPGESTLMSITDNEAEAMKMAAVERAKALAEKAAVNTDAVQVRTGGVARQIIQDGVSTTTIVPKYGVAYTPAPDPRMVFINGVEVRREVYETLRVAGTLPPDCVLRDPFLKTVGPR